MTIKTEKINITPHKSLFPKLGQAGYNVAEALSELIDNSIDARDDIVEINIKLDKQKDFILIEDNGLGMNKEVASKSIVLGSSNKKEGELGQFGIGLKTSCMSLGKRFTLETSPRNTDEEYVVIFDEDEFLSSGDWSDFEIKIKSGVDKNKSFTRIKIEKLRIRFYQNLLEVVKQHLSERFSPFIATKEVLIKVNGEKIQPEPYEIFPDTKQEFTIDLSNGTKIMGWTGILKKGSVERSGFNLYRYNRLIRAHEKLGYLYHPSKMAITGEIHMDPIPVTHNKREFITEDKLYIEFFEKFSELLKPILAEVNKRHQEEKIKDLPREIKETLKDDLLKALNKMEELKDLAFPGSNLRKRTDDLEGQISDKETRDPKDEEIGTIEKLPESEKDRNPRKTSSNKARFITIAGQKYHFDYEWRGLEEDQGPKHAYLDKEKNLIMVILNSNYPVIKVITKPDIFYHTLYLTEGIIEVFLLENSLAKEKVIEYRDKLIGKLADIMSEDFIDENSKRDSQVLGAQTYLLKKDELGTSPITDDEKLVLQKRIEEGLTYQEIGNQLKLSRQRIDQLFKSALNKISNIYNQKEVEETPLQVNSKESVEESKKVDTATIDSVIESTASMYGVSKKDLLGSTRKANLILPRHTVMFVLRKDLKLSFPRIAKIMNRKDHTTIMYAYTKMERILNEKTDGK